MSYNPEYHRQYYWKHKDKIRARQRELAKTPERKAAVRAWRDANRETLAAKKAAYRISNIDKHREWQNAYVHRLREQVLDAYGHACECCGEYRKEFLAIDHVNGGGKKHKQGIGATGGGTFYVWLRKNGYPRDGFRLLCHNCNQSRGAYGYCPHAPFDLSQRKKA